MLLTVRICVEHMKAPFPSTWWFSWSDRYYSKITITALTDLAFKISDCPWQDSPQPRAHLDHTSCYSAGVVHRKQRIFVDFKQIPIFNRTDFNVFFLVKCLSWTEVRLLSVLSNPPDSVLLSELCISITHRRVLTCLLDELSCQNGAARSGSLCDWPHWAPQWNTSFSSLSHLLTFPRARKACHYSKDHVRTHVFSAS